MKKIVLVGYMASGKTKIGKKLSKKLDFPFYDLDHIIENKFSTTINKIFEEKGEVYFRKIEHEAFVEKMNSDESFILSLGGGTPCYANNHELLKLDNVISVYLKASVTTLKNRLKFNREKRPLVKDLNDEELTEYIAKHLFDRSFYYNQSKVIITVDEKSPDEIAKEIKKHYSK
jgi:shikimate kinase